MLLKKLLDVMESEFPADSALDGDKVGLRIQGSNYNVNHILVAMEINDEVVDLAIKLNCDCIISFHPLIFLPLSEIISDERVGRIATKLIKNDISQITIHTNFDVHSNGTNFIFGKLLGLEFESYLIPDKKYQNKGMGIIGRFAQALTHEKLAELINQKTFSPVRFCIGKNDKIRKVAIICGSGSSFVNDVLKTDCDALITADCTYHLFHRLKGKLSLFDLGHYEMEQFVPTQLKSILENLLINEDVRISISDVLTNPVAFYPRLDYFEKQSNYLNNKMGIE